MPGVNEAMLGTRTPSKIRNWIWQSWAIHGLRHVFNCLLAIDACVFYDTSLTVSTFKFCKYITTHLVIWEHRSRPMLRSDIGATATQRQMTSGGSSCKNVGSTSPLGLSHRTTPYASDEYRAAICQLTNGTHVRARMYIGYENRFATWLSVVGRWYA